MTRTTRTRASPSSPSASSPWPASGSLRFCPFRWRPSCPTFSSRPWAWWVQVPSPQSTWATRTYSSLAGLWWPLQLKRQVCTRSVFNLMFHYFKNLIFYSESLWVRWKLLVQIHDVLCLDLSWSPGSCQCALRTRARRRWWSRLHCQCWKSCMKVGAMAATVICTKLKPVIWHLWFWPAQVSHWAGKWPRGLTSAKIWFKFFKASKLREKPSQTMTPSLPSMTRSNLPPVRWSNQAPIVVMIKRLPSSTIWMRWKRKSSLRIVLHFTLVPFFRFKVYEL